MNKNVEILINFRNNLLKAIEGLSIADLNTIPENYNNNIIWNLAHLNAVVQTLCYKYSNLPLTIDDKYYTNFLPGTKPTEFIDELDFKIIKEQFIETIIDLNNDLGKNIFNSYNKVEKIKTVYGIDVKTIEDALKYITHHEGIHYNAIKNLIRLIHSK